MATIPLVGQPEDAKNGAPTVLLVQTDDALLGSLRQLFENDGYRVLVANSGEAALGACQHRAELDLLVTDVPVGATNGFDLSIAVATAYSHITVIFTGTPPTALLASECDICRKALAHFVVKPFTYSQLRKKLVQLSTGAECSTLEWLLHSYDEVKRDSDQKPIPAEQSEEVHPIALHLEAVERQHVLLLKGLIQQPNGKQSSCLIEPQIRTLRVWQGLRLTNLESIGKAVVRLLVRPAIGGQLEEVVPLCQLEKEAIISALAVTKGHKRRAAKKLGLGVSTLYRKLQEYGIVVARSTRSTRR